MPAPQLPRSRACLKALYKILGTDATKPAPPRNQIFKSCWDHLGETWCDYLKQKPIKVVFDKTHFPYPGVKGELLEYQGQRYRLVNVGYEQMKVDRPLMDAAYSEAFGNESKRFAEFEYAGEKLRATQYLESMNRAIKRKVRKVYARKKDFLLDEDFKAIKMNDLHRDKASDLFVLLKDRGISPELLTRSQFEEDALMTIRVTRASTPDPGMPTAYTYRNGGGSLPLFNRAQDSNEIIKLIRQIDAHKGVAELTRYARFGEVPEPIRDAMLYRAFLVARDETSPIGVFVASMDREIRNYLEKPWQFKELVPFKTGQSQTPEYLMYLKTDGSEYKAALKRFYESAKKTFVEPLLENPHNGLPK